jgi:hypothetical protein
MVKSFKNRTKYSFSIVRKESFEVENLEALVLELQDYWILKEDNYFKDLKFRYFYLLHKYQLEKSLYEPVQFFKHRPDNFQRLFSWPIYIISAEIFTLIL